MCDGEFLTANLAIVQDTGNALHTHPHHDEVVVSLDGEVDFRVGDTIRQVRPGDLVFIPRTTVHGPILADGDRLAALSVFTPHFDPGKPDNFVWQRDTADAAAPGQDPASVHPTSAPSSPAQEAHHDHAALAHDSPGATPGGAAAQRAATRA